MVDSYKVTFNVTDHAVFEFENMFNGDKMLSDTLLKAVNDNWRLVIDEITDAVEDAYSQLLTEVSKHFFNVVPVHDIFSND